MPPRPPPSPPVLTVLCTIAALAAVWLSTTIEQFIRAFADRNAAIPFTLAVLAGPALILGLALLLHGMASVFRTPGWLRGFALVWLVVALLWVPTALATAVLTPGGGPVAELYARLGSPQAGRWTALPLAALMLVLVAGVVSGRAVATGRSWMRADAPEFRRRLVRVTAGWPGAAAVVALGVWAGWAMTPLLAILPVAVLLTFHLRTR